MNDVAIGNKDNLPSFKRNIPCINTTDVTFQQRYNQFVIEKQYKANWRLMFMCKILINEVMLGKRNVGFECYSMETGEVVGYTEKQIKAQFQAGNPVLGFMLDADGQLKVDETFCKNIMCKSGISTLTPKLETDCIVNLIFTVIGREGSQYKVISSRFWQGYMTEEKLKTLYELGAVNGIEIDNKGKITLCLEKEKRI